MSPTDLEARVAQASPVLAELARRNAGVALLRFESVDDLVAGIQQEALRSLPSLAWQGEDAFRGWLLQIARRHLHARRDHWFALKRCGAPVLRLTLNSPHPPSSPAIGPRTFAQRREELAAVTRALALLPARDRDLIIWSTEGVSPEDAADRMGSTPEAIRKASSRAIERLRKMLAIVTAPERPPSP